MAATTFTHYDLPTVLGLTDTIVRERQGTSAIAGTVLRTHFMGGYAEGPSMAAYYLTVSDHLGNVRDVVAGPSVTYASSPPLAPAAARYDYSVFHRPVRQANGIADSAATTPSLLVNGRYYQHTPTGLELALYRAYDPALGRFINEDPIQEEGGLNLYGYVGNGPLTKFDPLGLDDLTLFKPNSTEKKNADRSGPGKSCVKISAHGDNYGGVSDQRSGKGQDIKPKDLAAQIKGLSSYNPNVDVCLIVCHAGSSGNMAQELSKYLPNKVHGPTDTCRRSQSRLGEFILSEGYEVSNDGSWQAYQDGNAVSGGSAPK